MANTMVQQTERSLRAHDHRVQFYEDDAWLCSAASQFLLNGLNEGNAAIVIATAAHRKALLMALDSQGLDSTALEKSNRLTMLDARETLDLIMNGGQPDGERFRGVLGGVMERSQRISRSAVHAYGEMVDLLWKDGNAEGACRLEDLWNDLMARYSFSLLCAYSIENFAEDVQSSGFANVCRSHSSVFPTEEYMALDSPEKLREVAELQQKAHALQTEVRWREERERLLRATIRQLEEAREALRFSQQELADILENAAEGIHRVGPDGTILWANPAELQLMGYSAEEYIGHNIAEFHADPNTIQDILARLYRKESLHNYEAVLRCKDGSLRCVLLSSNVLWRNGEFVYTRCFTRDITERKQAEHVLEETVAERTASLREAMDQLEEFSYAVSHDLRAPLRAINGYADVLLEDHAGHLSPQARSYLAEIKRNSRLMDDLTGELLRYGRTLKSELSLGPVNVEELLATLLPQSLELQPPRARVHIESPLLPVQAHAAGLTQCLSNLLMNGVKFVSPGTVPELRVRTEARGDRVRIWVEDNGIGIDPRHQHRLFRLFERLAGEGYSGVGMGLAIVRRSIEKMGGSCGVESDGINGSRFWLELAGTERPNANQQFE